MKLNRKLLHKLIIETIEMHVVEDELDGMDPHEAYGNGYIKGKEQLTKMSTNQLIDLIKSTLKETIPKI